MASLVPHPFVGRTAEMSDLTRLIDRAAAGQGGVVVVAGDAGIGKTRLCEELAVLATVRGLGVAWTACWESGGLPAFWPWRQLLTQLEAELPSLPPHDADPDEARARFFDAVFDVVGARARANPRVMILDDVHCADAGTLRLLVHVSPLLRSVPAMLVATARETPMGPAVLPRELVRHARVQRLGGLKADELAELVEALTGSRHRPEVIGTVHQATDGNPLFATELVRQLRDHGDLDGLTRQDLVVVPPTVRAILDERLSELGDRCRRLLALGSVMGQEFPLGLVAEVAGLDALDAARDLSEASQSAVRAIAADRFAFAHPLIRRVLYDDIPIGERVLLHKRVGEALEATVTRGGHVDPALLSFHYLQAAAAGTAGQAVRYAEQAARSALATLAYEDAMELYERALAANELDPAGSDRVALLLGAGEARGASGDRQGERDAFIAAADLARRSRRPAELAKAALGLAGAGFEVALFDNTQVSLLEEALAQLGEGEPGLRSRLSARLSVALSLSGQEKRRALLSQEAVRLAEAAGAPAALAQALAARCDAHAGPAYVTDRAADAAQIVRIGRERGDHGTELLGRRLHVVACLEAGDIAAADAEMHAFAQLADRLRQPRYQWYVALWRATRAAMRGRLTEQRAHADEAERLGRAARSAHSEVLVPAHRWFSWLEAGEIETAVTELNRLMPAGSFSELGVQTVPIFAMRQLVAGRPEEARAMIDHAAEDIMAADRDSEWLTVLGQIADVCFRLGGHPLAGRLYDALVPFAEVWVMDGIGAYVHGPAHRYLGLLAALLGRSEQAAAHFDAAEAGARGAGADLLVARTLFDRGVGLAEPGALRRAQDVYRRLGVDRRVADIEDRLAGPPPAAELTGARPTTGTFRREGDVWAVSFAGQHASVRDSKGMGDLARLLAQPGREIPALDLAGAIGGAQPEGDLGEIVDARARAAYQARLVELDAELDEADAHGDLERSARAQIEKDALVEQLTTAYGLGGRPRRSGDPAERSRTTVTARIHRAVRHIETLHPQLGRHLSRSVRTGTFCSYDPDDPISWEL